MRLTILTAEETFLGDGMQFQKLFVAIPLPSEHHHLVTKVEQQLDAQAGMRWVRPEQLHLTLKFLGEVDNRLLHQACELMRTACEEIASFEIQLSGLGTFPPNKRPRVLWTGISAGIEQLQELHRRLDDAFGAIGVPVEGRVYRPHLTLARIGKSADAHAVEELVNNDASQTEAQFFAQRIVLFESQKAGRYYQYEPLAEVQLG